MHLRDPRQLAHARYRAAAVQALQVHFGTRLRPHASSLLRLTVSVLAVACRVARSASRLPAVVTEQLGGVIVILVQRNGYHQQVAAIRV